MPYKLEHDWYEGLVPDNVEIHPTAYVETAMVFDDFRSRAEPGLTLGEGSGLYTGSVLDVGPRGQIRVGRFTTLTAPMIQCDQLVEFGDHCLVSWSVVLMDAFRFPTSPRDRAKLLLDRAARRLNPVPDTEPPISGDPPRPIRIGHNVWIGFEAMILPGVTIGDGAVVGARSVVFEDVPPHCVVAGNPARVVKQLTRPSP